MYVHLCWLLEVQSFNSIKSCSLCLRTVLKGAKNKLKMMGLFAEEGQKSSSPARRYWVFPKWNINHLQAGEEMVA